VSVPIAMPSPLPPLALSQHPDQHRSERPVLLAVDQQLGEDATLRVAPELPDPVGPLDAKISRHAGGCEFASETDPAVLRILLKVQDGVGAIRG
jgi:hypothetical protein